MSVESFEQADQVTEVALRIDLGSDGAALIELASGDRDGSRYQHLGIDLDADQVYELYRKLRPLAERHEREAASLAELDAERRKREAAEQARRLFIIVPRRYTVHLAGCRTMRDEQRARHYDAAGVIEELTPSRYRVALCQICQPAGNATSSLSRELNTRQPGRPMGPELADATLAALGMRQDDLLID